MKDGFREGRKRIKKDVKTLLKEQFLPGSIPYNKTLREEMRYGDEMSDLRGEHSRRIKEYRSPGELVVKDKNSSKSVKKTKKPDKISLKRTNSSFIVPQKPPTLAKRKK